MALPGSTKPDLKIAKIAMNAIIAIIEKQISSCILCGALLISGFLRVLRGLCGYDFDFAFLRELCGGS
jgi:hypothetical protein